MEKDEIWSEELLPQHNISSVDGTASEKIKILSVHQVAPPKIISFDHNNKKRYSDKKQFCLFCEKLVSRFGRHLIGVHKDKKEVIEITNLPPKSLIRKKKIDVLRCKGNYQFNHSENSKTQIVARRCHRKNEPDVYTDCPSCLMRVSKLTLRKHYRKCDDNYDPKLTTRDTYVKSKIVTLPLHPLACPVLKTQIFPYFRNDESIQVIRNDYLAILYGNKLVAKYRDQHHYKMIKANLRYIGRFLLQMRHISRSINDLASCFEPCQYDNVVASIKTVAKFDEEGGYFNAPTTASTLGTILKFCAAILISECIKKSNENKKLAVKNFLELLRTDLGADINRTVTENQVSKRRKKKVILPSTQDLKKFLSYLKEQRTKYFSLLRIGFSFYNWKQLASYTLVGILIYNGRRPGETERIFISDYKETAQSTVEYQPSQPGTHPSDKESDYTRIVLRGKLMRNVTVVLNKYEVEAIELIIKYRKEAGVDEKNPFIFGLPGSTKPHKHLSAGLLLKKYASKAELSKPHLFFATNIRKNLATKTAKFELHPEDREHIVNFMGHSSNIHKNIYRQPDIEKDINVMPKVLNMVFENLGEADRIKCLSPIKTGHDVEPRSFNEDLDPEKPSTSYAQHDISCLRNSKTRRDVEKKLEYDSSSDETFIPSEPITDTSESEIEVKQKTKREKNKLIGNVFTFFVINKYS